VAVPQTIEDRFVIEAEAASGGMGTVYRGRDRQSGAAVAIKILHRSGVVDQQRFVREATILADLVHPGIVRYVAHGILEPGSTGSPYLVMDWVPGETLEARLRGTGVTVAESVVIARQVAAALAFAHGRGVVHRDIKPSNLIFPDGDLERAMVLDFGVARSVSQAGSLTETGSVVGTPSYMAPEQVRGDRDVGPAADVFALGCVLYECVTGRLTFEGLRFLALRAKILLWDPPPARIVATEVPFELDQLLSRMLAKLPAERPRDGAALIPLLAALAAIEAPVAPRRTRRRTDTPTDLLRAGVVPSTDASRLVSIVLATTPEGVDPSGAPTMTFEALTTLRGSLDAALRPFEASLDVLQDGALVAVLTETSTAAELARRAAGCARAIRRAIRDALIAITTGEARPDEEAALIEQAVQGLSKDAMSVVFSGTHAAAMPVGAIRIDARTASLIEPEVALVRVKGSIYLPAT
jgi:serine/threonine protein kinase